MPTLKEHLQFVSEGGSVVRYHTRPGIKPETDAHHSHEVAMLCYLLTGNDTGDPADSPISVQLLMAALTHDLGEQGVGDVPAPTKWQINGMKEKVDALEAGILNRFGLNFEPLLTEAEQHTLKMADMFACMLGTVREISLGNRNSMLIWRRINYYAHGVAPYFTPMERAVHKAICDIYTEAISATGPDYDVYR